MEPDEGPPAKKKKTNYEERCIFCEVSLTKTRADDPVVANPTKEGLKSILNAAEHRKDEVFDRLSPIWDDILNKNVKIRFHKKCRANYTTKRNVLYARKGTTVSDNQNDRPLGLSRLRRLDTTKFNVRSDCFICGKSYKWNEKLTPISTGKGESTRKRVLDAALERNDDEIKMRMLAYPDLFAMDAKYHRSCYSHYISENNIKAAKGRAALGKPEDEPAFNRLCKEIESTVLSTTPTITTLSSLHEQLSNISKEHGNSNRHSVRNLKVKLMNYFGDRLSFISQPGKPDLVCSGNVTVGDALRKLHVTHLQVHENEVGECELQSMGEGSDDDYVILHRAAGIIRNLISGLTFQSQGYDPSGKINTSESKAFVPDGLYDFIAWCTSKKDFDGAVSYDSVNDLGKINMKVLAICHNLISLGCKIGTPITFSLGVRMHHVHGSKELIDDLNSSGHSISYDEVRKFLTSIAEDQLSSQAGVYVPKDLSRFEPGNVHTTLDAAIDNFDQNEETIDGKNTTHAMSIVVYQRSPPLKDQPPIPRSNRKSLSTDASDEDAIQRYNKPHKKPEPSVTWEPNRLEAQENSGRGDVMKDLIWLLARATTDSLNIPAWGGFNSLVTTRVVPQARIRYLPFINGPPSAYSTIYTSLLKLVQLAGAREQDHIMVTADMAIYSKAQQILWAEPDALSGRVTMRLGGMHLTMSFIASIGKLFGDGGLQHMLTASDVYADGTASSMLQGKQYDRGLRGIRLVHEALSHLLLSSAEVFAVKNGLPWFDDSTQRLIKELNNAFKVQSPVACSFICDEIHVPSNVLQTIDAFKASGRKQSATFWFWLNFLHAVDILLKLLRADREANFELHLEAVKAGHINYARYTPVYLAEMMALEESVPEMYMHLVNGGFVVRRSEKTFNCVPTDQALEQSINREAKSRGGVIGFTLRKGALLRWLLTRAVTGEYSQSFKEMCQTAKARKSHEELGTTRRGKDQNDVTRIKGFISEQCQNPFDLDSVPTKLVNITTGQVATEDVEKSLTEGPEKGKSMMERFTKERMVEKSTGFWEPIKKTPLATFASMKKCLTNDKERKMMIDTEVLFRRLLAVSKYREIDMHEVLKYELAAVPPAMFHDDGKMRKTKKSDLAVKLEENGGEIVVLPQISLVSHTDAYLIDGMAMIQSLNENHFKTFNDVGNLVLKRCIRILNNRDMDVAVVTVVFDRYDQELSIKSSERDRRGTTDGGIAILIQGNRDVPNYRCFLKSAVNKASLAAFISDYVCSNGGELLPARRSIILAGGFKNGELVRVVNEDGVSDVDDLKCTHEEADTRLLLHAVNLSSHHSRTIMRCDDTDVLVLLLYYWSRGMLSTEVFMHCGHSGQDTTRERYIPVHEIANKLGSDVCNILPSVHALSGCDSTSAMYRMGKRTAYSVLTKNAEALQGLGDLHDADTFLKSAMDFVLLMHGKKAKNQASLNELRFHLASTTDKPASQLPPTEDAYEQHALRARYQTVIWCQSHTAMPEIASPVGHGWHLDNMNELKPTLYRNESAPVEVRNVTHLYCTDKSCKGQNCQCWQAGLECIEICSCGPECNNPYNRKQENVDEIGGERDTDEDNGT
jgi:hypothetical protein